MIDVRVLDPPVIVKVILNSIYFLFLGHKKINIFISGSWVTSGNLQN